MATPPFKHLDALVGRETEARLLEAAYLRVLKSPRSCEAVLIHGDSGAGKTALVQHSFQHQKDKGTMISGKFEVTGTQRPYSAIVDALTQLCLAPTWNNISNEENFQANLFRQLSASDLEILSKLAPAVELRLASLVSSSEGEENEELSDSSPDQPSHDNAFAFARFTEILRSFLYLVARFLSSPLILFLDDVQAADSESVSLIASLTSQHSKSCNLLLVLAMRETTDEERASMISHTTECRVTNITVGNLEAGQVNKLISMMLRMDEEDTISLGQLITQRTGGNVYLTMQFAEMLKSKKLLGYSFDSCRWEWNLEKIRSDTNVADNVALLLTSRIQQLPADVQLALQLAACLGFYFDIQFLELITVQECQARTNRHLDPTQGRESTPMHNEGSVAIPEEVLDVCKTFSDAITVATEENLIDRAEGTKYKFTHDRVLQAAYGMIPSGMEKTMLHWRIGQVLWAELQRHHQEEQNEKSHFSETSNDWLLFATADQLNRGSNGSLRNDDAVTRLDLTRLFLAAGKAALEKSAFQHAAKFFDRGVQSIGSRWRSEYSLCLELHTLSAEAEYAASNFENCENRVDQVLTNGLCLEDKLRAYLVKVQSQGVRGNVRKALDESISVLRILGQRIPRRANVLHILMELVKTKRVLKGRKAADLGTLPMMTDSLQAWAVTFLKNVAIFSWFAGQNECLFVAVCRMVQITVKFGVSAQGPFVLAAFGLALGSMGDFEGAYEVGKAALELAKRPHTRSSYASAVATVFSFLNHLKEPMIRSLDAFLDGYNAAIKSGDIEGAALCLSGYATMGIYLGKKLDVVASETEGFRQTYRDEFERNFALMFMTPWHQLVLSLMGQSASPGDLVCDDAYMAEVERTGNEVAKATLNVARLLLFYIMGDFEEASIAVANLDLDVVTKGTHFATPFILMYAALIMLAMARKTRKAKYSRRALFFKGIMHKFKRAGNLNMPPLLEIVSAEQASLRRNARREEVKKAYESAVKMASRRGFSVVEACGNERAGEYMQAIGDDFWAETYLSRAFLLYGEWGAATKTKQMAEKYGFLGKSDRVSPVCKNVSITLRKRYSYRAANESRRLSLSRNEVH